jgi:hypothetical protein
LEIPVILTKVPNQTKKDIHKNSEEDKFNEIDELLKSYVSEMLKGNFYEMKKIKNNLV